METKVLKSRQEQLEDLIKNALQDDNLVDALSAFQMGQEEYTRALISSATVQITSGDTTNPGEKQNANLDRN